MELIYVDVVGVETREALFETEAQATGDVAIFFLLIVVNYLFGSFIHVVAELGGNDHFVASAFECLAKEPLAVPRAIIGGGVEEIDTQLEPALDATQRLGVVDLAPACGPSI